MKKEIGVLIGIAFFFALFISIGFPLLRDMQGNIEDIQTAQMVGTNLTPDRTEDDDDMDSIPEEVEKIDVYDEPLCDNDIRCDTEHGCDGLCVVRGCREYGLEYNGSVFDSQVGCSCLCK
ncbi:MAG: hypothetical protein ACOCZQ_03520 [Nanoarchaeota archaeon]